MRVEVGRIDPGLRRCDCCESLAPPIWDCAIPYGERKRGDASRSQYWCLCADCIEHIRKHPSPYVALDTRLPEIAAPPQLERASGHSGKVM